ncbi:MAG TPA: hypothetical protein VEJ39_08290 [Candidatus Acidoferrales bacterium]|nr:hypothetical protein [Candidatus Acidoferrales bacterium]
MPLKAFGDVTLTLRPIKFAFLVNPAEREMLDRVVQASLFQWGGLHNPIVPIFRRLPRYWSDLPTRRLAPGEVCKGYLRMFDPDAVIVCGTVDKSVIPAHVQHIHTFDEFVGDLSKEDAPTFGVGFFELLGSFAEEEFKYTRRDGMKLLMPVYEEKNVTLLKMVLGDIPAEARRETYRELMKRIDVEERHVTIDNFLQVIREQHALLSSICADHLQLRRRIMERSLAVFLMDHRNGLDLIDFWNLRAIGWHVLPIPLALSGLADTQSYARAFIEHNRPGDKLQGITEVAVLKGRSVSQTDFDRFVASIPRAAGQSLTVQVWYPPMWDEFTRRGSRLTCSSIVAGEERSQLSEETSFIRTKALAPKFMAPNLGHGPRYANDIRVAMYGRSEFGAEVVPPYEKTVGRLYGIGLGTDWRTGPGGLTFLGRFADSTIHLNQPSPREVVTAVLAERGWKGFEFSPPGNIAYQMMRHLDGPLRIGILQNAALIRFLETLAAGRDTAEEEKVRKGIESRLKGAAGTGKLVPLADATNIVSKEIAKMPGASFVTHDVEEREFLKNMHKIANSLRFPIDVGTLVENCTGAKIFNLGVRVQCSVCGQRSWHPLEAIRAEVQCPICLSEFPLPTHKPRDEIKWSYKSLGPFALPKQGFGAYSVLLTVRFLSGYQHPATTPVFSFRAKQGDKELEADFMMFYRSATYWERETEAVYGECKSFNGFTEKDVRRMRQIAAADPGAILVFATLAPELSPRDKRLLSPFVRACRKYGELDRPKNPVLLLTGTELFSGVGPPQCWRDAGGRMKAFAEASRPIDSLVTLCDATQQLHLGLPSWWNDWTDEFEKRRRARGSKAAGRGTGG